jgi:hypothetical protein
MYSFSVFYSSRLVEDSSSFEYNDVKVEKAKYTFLVHCVLREYTEVHSSVKKEKIYMTSKKKARVMYK